MNQHILKFISPLIAEWLRNTRKILLSPLELNVSPKGNFKRWFSSYANSTITSKDKAWTRIGFEKESIQIQNIKKPYNTGKKVLASKNWVWSSGFTL